MRLGQFILVSVLAALAVGVMSYTGGAGAGTIVFRVIATIVLLQLGYFAVLLALAAMRPKADEPVRDNSPAKPSSKSAPPARD